MPLRNQQCPYWNFINSSHQYLIKLTWIECHFKNVLFINGLDSQSSQDTNAGKHHLPILTKWSINLKVFYMGFMWIIQTFNKSISCAQIKCCKHLPDLDKTKLNGCDTSSLWDMNAPNCKGCAREAMQSLILWSNKWCPCNRDIICSMVQAEESHCAIIKCYDYTSAETDMNIRMTCWQ